MSILAIETTTEQKESTNAEKNYATIGLQYVSLFHPNSMLLNQIKTSIYTVQRYIKGI